MSRENYLQFIASFMAVLVLTIPFYTTSVYASINKVTVKGSDGIENFARLDDFLTFNVQAFISGDTITKDQVVLGSGTQFDKCVPSISNGSDCTLRYPGNGTQAFTAIAEPFTINLFTDNKTLDDSEPGSFTVDNKAPEINLSVSKSEFSSADKIIVSYSAADTACDDPSCAGLCVGIKNIEFFDLEGIFEQNVDVETSTCNFASNISIDTEIFSDGTNSVFAKATDRFDQVSPDASVTFTIDTSAPLIVQDSFDIIRNGIRLSTFSSSAVDVDVKINISASDLDFGSVTADFSALNPDLNLTKAKASCESVGDDLNICSWTVSYSPETAGTKTITINASDASGNAESAAILKSLTLDDDGPVVLSLLTNAETDGKSLAKPSGNTVIATFDEVTGLSKGDVILHVDGSELEAASCSKDIDWSCEWQNVGFGSSKTAKISIESDTTDALGNAAGNDTFADVTIDDEPPVLAGINISNIGGIVPAFPGFFKIGDKISVVANLTDDNDISAAADFSKFIIGASNVAGSCEKIQADEQLCTWLTDAIELEDSDSITFNFSDAAGNSLIVTKALKTFGLENATAPDFWSNTVSCTPKTIDRSLGPLISQRSYCQVSLKQKSTTKAVSTVSIGEAECTGGSSVVQNTETFNTEAGSTSPVIKITLIKGELNVNSVNLSCSLDIFSKIGNTSTVTKNPEVENVNINLEFFNLPLGELSEEVKDKIDEAKKDAEGIWELISTLNKFIFYAKKICQLINTIYTIVAILYIAYAIIKGTEVSCSLSGIGEAIGLCSVIYTQAVKVGVNVEGGSQTVDAAKKGLNYFCDYVTCKQTILWGPIVQNFINKNEIVGLGFGAQNYLDKPLSSYMKPESNLVVATLFACLPGIVYGLDKYRQIKCLYADCLQNAVGKEGIPITACEDQKAYSTCKYVTGEIFALIPYTALFDHFMGLIKNSLSNPFAALGIAASVLCSGFLFIPRDILGYQTCRGLRLLNLVGDAAQNVKDIIDTGFTIRTDYCARLEKND